jgi:hypothetical protein
MRKFRRPSPGLIVAFIALFIAAGGGSWAAASGSSKPSTRTAKSASTGPRGPRGFRGFTGPRGPRGPTGLTGAQGPAGPSDGFVKRQPAVAGLTSGTDTTVAQLSLTPDRSYIVTAATELGNVSGVSNLVGCTLLENFNPIAGGSASLNGSNAFQQTITLTAATTGGNIKLSCNPDAAASARNSVITAIRVGTLHTQ